MKAANREAEVLAVMQDGKAYSFHELIALIPHVPVSILS